MVFPFIARTTSPGLVARPEGMFSVAATRPRTETLGLSFPSARMVARTAADPAMSHFIVSIPPAGLSEMPPESKVSPLPTRAIFLLALCLSGS